MSDMDSNETLRLLRLTIKQMRVDEDPGVRKAHADEIAEYFEALDAHLSAGGTPPEEWREGPDAPGEGKPEDYTYNGQRFTHYKNHGGAWQTMAAAEPVPDFARRLDIARGYYAGVRDATPDEGVTD